MPVQYVNDFSFAPSPPRPTIRGYARGGHVKASTPFAYKNGGLAKGHGVSNDSGHTCGNGPDRFSKRPQGDGPVKYMAKGGLAKGKGLSNDSGHTGNNGPDASGSATRGQGDGDIKRSKVSADIKKSVTEKSSGVQRPAFAKGGIAKCYAEGGKVAAGKQWMGSKPSRNRDDATSPGSFKRTPVGQGEKNSKAANSKFSAEVRNTPVATKQDGNVERMSGFSDFKNGGRIKNLGHYAHGGKVKATRSEVPSGKAGSGKIKSPEPQARGAGKYESKAGTPKTSPGTRVEMKFGVAKAAMGGLSRGTSPRKNAAIHAKQHKAPHAPKGLGALAGALSGQAMPSQGAGAPPGMAPGMGAPPGGQMGAMAPQAPMGGMSHGGGVKHVVVHHVSHR